ncbi:TetR/AcrR family transcriptional regulator [Umezawaea endophytica]|uniref:TetR/AcrR family transcriptional regulator n=1 Tax=Umezawaea endophytica TaxID=1654476 RepID=A0A9X2VG13_9PSEU|nr:TetR/AcrR family transcriptional regulator [Umezawaea endophytica]MCS7475975.1 TetR/AcrR family transcriptional regulator [Umezawaea endophytica]
MGTSGTDFAPPLSPRRRLLAASTSLFYRNGIQATGVSELCEVAGVSKRTLYQLYGGKDELVAAYLEHARDNKVIAAERALFDDSLPPRERLARLFDRPDPVRFRGCPFHNASVELTTAGHPAEQVIRSYKEGFERRIAESAREAGCRDPEGLGRVLMLLFEGAMSLATSTGDLTSFDSARPLAEKLVAEATGA